MPTTPFEHLTALLGDQDSVKVPIGAIGFGSTGEGRTRYATVFRAPSAIPLTAGIYVSIYDNVIACVTWRGAEVRTLGHYTPSTRAAVQLIFPKRHVSMSTPGSRGGKRGPWRCIIAGEGTTTEVGDAWTMVPDPMAVAS